MSFDSYYRHYSPQEYYSSSKEEMELERKLSSAINSMGEKAFLEKYEDKILELENPTLSYSLMKIKGSKKEQHRKVILKSDNGTYNYRLLLEYYSLHPFKYRQHLAALENSKDSKYIYYLYKRSSKRDYYANKIVDMGDPRANAALFCDTFLDCNFLNESISNESISFDVKKNRQIIIDGKDPYYNNYYVESLIWLPSRKILEQLICNRELTDKEVFELVKPHADVVINNQNCDLEYCSLFIDHLTRLNCLDDEDVIEYINKFANRILKSEDYYRQLDCACTLTRTGYKHFDVTQFEDAVIQSKDIDNVINYAKKVKSANLTRIEDVILGTNNPDYCIKYVSEFPTSRIRDFARVVIYNGELEQMEAFFKHGIDAIYLTIEKEFEAFSYLYSLTMNENIIKDRIDYLSNKNNVNPRVKRECMAVLKSNLNEQLESIVDPEEEFEALLRTRGINKGNSTKK